MVKQKQEHLAFKEQVNLGSFYTPQPIVDIVYKIIKRNISNIESYKILDSSCGYGSFFNDPNLNYIGADIDDKAIEEAKKAHEHNKVQFINCNSLYNINRNLYNIKNEEKLLVIGNPPYNDTTSMIRHTIKEKKDQSLIDNDVKSRDLGMSFLLSYNKLNADYVCILHPLSYLIKKTNFKSIKQFVNNYKLIDNLIISSHEFFDTSKGIAFPIIIALYKKDEIGMDYEYIYNYQFKTKEGTSFCLNDYQYISDYIGKYPNEKSVNQELVVAKFYTLRDINALKRNRTFIDTNYNAIHITLDKLPYYCYIDVFKKNCDKIPYYFGNFDIIINITKFNEIKDYFVYESLKNKENMQKYINKQEPNEKIIDNYFKDMLGEHYDKNNNK